LKAKEFLKLFEDHDFMITIQEEDGTQHQGPVQKVDIVEDEMIFDVFGFLMLPRDKHDTPCPSEFGDRISLPTTTWFNKTIRREHAPYMWCDHNNMRYMFQVCQQGSK
jgi:hypothetical protein